MKTLLFLILSTSILTLSASELYTYEVKGTVEANGHTTIHYPLISYQNQRYNLYIDPESSENLDTDKPKLLDNLCQNLGFTGYVRLSVDYTSIKNSLVRSDVYYSLRLNELMGVKSFSSTKNINSAIRLIKCFGNHFVSAEKFKKGIYKNYENIKINSDNIFTGKQGETVFESPYIRLHNKKYYLNPRSSIKNICDKLGFHEVSSSKFAKSKKHLFITILNKYNKLVSFSKTIMAKNGLTNNHVISQVSCWDKKETTINNDSESAAKKGSEDSDDINEF